MGPFPSEEHHGMSFILGCSSRREEEKTDVKIDLALIVEGLASRGATEA